MTTVRITGFMKKWAASRKSKRTNRRTGFYAANIRRQIKEALLYL